MHGVGIAEIPFTKEGREQEDELIVLPAAAKTDVGRLFNEIEKGFQAADGRVRATVRCAKGGDLSVVFIASSKHADLLGAVVTFKFSTDEGKELKGRKELRSDEANKGQLAAFWSENQTSLSPGGAAPPGVPEKKLTFEFQVLPVPPQEGEGNV
ncbi:hypothetical protein [Paludibaculum fermentans]|uniref:hypothetical protein n=1 Tax=Paludibaculum fermentans TaxID=1473598 RepID=UPI003EB7D234